MSKISAYDPAATLDGTEEVPIVQSGVTVKTTTQDIADLGGGLEHVVVPFAFDTPNLILTRFSIADVNQGTKTFSISQGDATSPLPPATQIYIGESTGNDGTYTVVSSTWNNPNTDVVVAEAIPDATVDGNLGIPGPVGIKLCDLNPGDVMPGNTDSDTWLSFCYLTEEFDGVGSPQIYLVATNQRLDLPTVGPGASPLARRGVGSVPSAIRFDYSGDGVLWTVGSAFDIDLGPMVCEIATSLWLWLDDDTGNHPLSTQGAGEVHLFICRA